MIKIGVIFCFAMLLMACLSATDLKGNDKSIVVANNSELRDSSLIDSSALEIQLTPQGNYNVVKEEIRKFMIEHEFGRNIARQISHHLKRWKNGEDAQEPVSRYLRTYAIFLNDHLNKEDKFFDTAEAEVLSKEEEIEMYEQYRSIFAIVKKVEELITDIDYLENQPWAKN